MPVPSELPHQPYSISQYHSNMRWVFLGAGNAERTSKALKARRINFMLLPMLLLPEKSVQLMLQSFDSDHAVKENAGFLVDAAQYMRARKIAEQETGFNLDKFSANPEVVFPGPPDAALKRRFDTLLPALIKIGAILADDPRTSNNDSPASSQAKARAQSDDHLLGPLLREAGNTMGWDRDKNGAFWLPVWGFGSAVNDDYDKGYAYMPYRPKGVVSSLDGFTTAGRVKTLYVHLRGNWYLYEEFIPD